MDSPPTAPLSWQGTFPSECLQTEEKPAPIPAAPWGAGFQQGLQQVKSDLILEEWEAAAQQPCVLVMQRRFVEDKENTEGPCIISVFLLFSPLLAMIECFEKFCHLLSL